MRDYGRRRSPARLLAPLALLVVAGACVAVVAASTGSDGDDDGGQSTTRTAERDRRENRGERRRRQRATYTVKLNDTLGLISEKTGVPVERLQELNPELDQQSLVVGQRIKLRE
jgi:hypothetical protein